MGEEIWVAIGREDKLYYSKILYFIIDFTESIFRKDLTPLEDKYIRNEQISSRNQKLIANINRTL